jgi:hypothetical protein
MTCVGAQRRAGTNAGRLATRPRSIAMSAESAAPNTRIADSNPELDERIAAALDRVAAHAQSRRLNAPPVVDAEVLIDSSVH